MTLRLLLSGLLVWLGLATTALASPERLEPLRPVVACASLAGTDLASVTRATTAVSLVREEGAGAGAYCRVVGTIAPAVTFEVHLPLAGWSQRYLQTGCGGLCGSLTIRADKSEGCAPITDGTVALASTDMGHRGMDMAWGGDPQKRADFATRGVHLTALAAKTLIQAFYGRAPKYAYFSGCSDGGREALIEAQRFPQDFDGIAAGAPALHFSVQNSFHHLWLARANTGPDAKPLLTAVDLPPLHAAVIKACAGGDGLIDDPRTCRFDPKAVQCAGEYRAGACLTPAQVAAVRAFYRGATGSKGERLEVAPLMPGSELLWAGVFVPRAPDQPIFSGRIALDTVNHLLFTPNPATPWTVADFPFDAAMAKRLEPARALYNAESADLSDFAGHGGKLILWHGWADPHISPVGTLAYWQRMGRRMGVAQRAASVRLFLLPGMGHCDGGEGPSQFPLLAALMDWVEQSKAPDVMIAHRPANQPALVREIRAWPGLTR